MVQTSFIISELAGDDHILEHKADNPKIKFLQAESTLDTIPDSILSTRFLKESN